MTVDTPISIGALYSKKTDGGRVENVRVKDIHIDEDGDTQVQIINDAERGSKECVDAETFIHRVETQLRRINSDHDAWCWQQKSRTKL